MTVLDASVLIAHFSADDAHHRRARQLLLSLVDQPLVSSVVTLAEVLVAPARAGTLPAAEAALHLLGVSAVSLPADAPRRLALLRAETRLRLPDCCVLLTAEESGVPVATFDAHLATAARSRGVQVQEGN